MRAHVCPQVLGCEGPPLTSLWPLQCPLRARIHGQDRGMFTSVSRSARIAASAWGIEGDFCDIFTISNMNNNRQRDLTRQHQPCTKSSASKVLQTVHTSRQKLLIACFSNVINIYRLSAQPRGDFSSGQGFSMNNIFLGSSQPRAKIILLYILTLFLHFWLDASIFNWLCL